MIMKRLKSLFYNSYIFVLMTLVGVCSCNGSGGDVMRLVEERDSLKAKNETTQQQLDAINGMVATLNSALDSITVEEGLIFVSKDPEVQLSRADAIKNLEHFEAIVRHQQKRISELEANMKSNNSDTNLQGLVTHLKEQIANKDAQIAQLRSQLQDKDVSIAQLRRYVDNQRSQIKKQSDAIAELDRRSKSQTEALKRQDEVINNCYVLLGSKKDLKRKGILKNGRIVSESLMDKSKFAKVDIRKWREISFEAKRPRILTNMPQSAFVLTTSGNNNFTLRITNPTAFWSISNFLVIQTD